VETLVLLMGSNVGKRKVCLEEALVAVTPHLGPPVASSQIWETAAWGGVAIDPFLNQAHRFSSTLDPFELLNIIKDAETKIGRTATERWGNREIDIDILIYGSRYMNEPSLHIPHARLEDRRFALISLCEVAPEWCHPVTGLSALRMLHDCRDETVARPFLPPTTL